MSERPLGVVARRFVWAVPFIAVLALLGSLMEGIGIGLLIPLLTVLLGPSGEIPSGPMRALMSRIAGYDQTTQLLIIAGTMFGLIALKNLIVAGSQIFIAWVDGRISHDIRTDLARQLLTVPYTFYLAEDWARLVNIVSTEAWRASDALRALFSIVGSLTATTVLGLLLLATDWRLSLVLLVGMIAIRLVHGGFLTRLRPISERVSEANRQLAERMLTSVTAMRIIRIFAQEPREFDKFRHASDAVRTSMFELERTSAGLSPLLEILHVGLFLLILVGAPAAGVQFPVLVVFLVLLHRLQPHLRSLEQARVQIAATAGAVREVEWLLDPGLVPAPPTRPLGLTRFAASIEFRDVNFVYGNRVGSGPVLSNISFTIARGRSVAIIGPSGSGKSTVVNLLCQLIEPTSGVILVDGLDLTRIDAADWRRVIGVAGQDVDLIDGTIADNIVYGAPQLTMAEIRAVARIAEADAFISALPDGYNTVVGTRGVSLSGGQRQRIGLARAMAKHPDILILDEATNSVDGLSEAAIMALLRAHDCAATKIVVSHRMSTLALCDDGIVIEDGKLVEAGLLTSLEAYKRMLSPQA